MKNVKLKENVYMQGFGTFEVGTELRVHHFNKRYIYCYLPSNERVLMQLTYKNIGKKSPIKRKAKSKVQIATEKDLKHLFGLDMGGVNNAIQR